MWGFLCRLVRSLGRRSPLVVALAAALLLSGCDWPMFRFGPAHTGFTPDTSISKDAVQGSMVLNWTGPTGSTSSSYGIISSPAVANGVVYVGSFDNKLYAFDAAGNTNCSGSPNSCNPLWTATTGGLVGSSPAVVNGVVYVGSDDHKLYAFDAAGNTNCSGSPKTCQPLWTATLSDREDLSSPTVANGIVYIGSGTSIFGTNNLYAFDAAGTTNCSGSPKTCQPLWSAQVPGRIQPLSPAVANGVVYVGTSLGLLFVYDAAGNTNCSGSPKLCQPLWAAAGALNLAATSSPAIANGLAYVGGAELHGPGHKLYVFDAAGNTNCSGSPKTCQPLWTAPVTAAGQITTPPAVANGVVYFGTVFENRLYAVDAAGSTGCSGSPKVCNPLWTAAITAGSPPAVANGVVYVGSGDGKLYAFDAAGSTGCSGSPKTCQPLSTFVVAPPSSSVNSSPAVSNGVVYIGSADTNLQVGLLYAFGLEKVPPTTSVVVPSDGATVSGTTTLDASASDNVKVSKVEFRLTGGSLNNALIGVVHTPSNAGWIVRWDTTTVPNGVYTLNSVAYDPAGNSGRSPDISITVQN
jgi:outer membrane protein assembly factor BamB